MHKSSKWSGEESKRKRPEPNRTKGKPTKNMYECHTRMWSEARHTHWALQKVRMLKIKSILIHSIRCKLHFFIRRFFDVRFLLSFCLVWFCVRLSILRTFFWIVFAILSFCEYDRYDFLYKCVPCFAYAFNKILTFLTHGRCKMAWLGHLVFLIMLSLSLFSFCTPLSDFFLEFRLPLILSLSQSTIIIQSNRILYVKKTGLMILNTQCSFNIQRFFLSVARAMAQISTWTLVDWCACVEVDNNHSQL